MAYLIVIKGPDQGLKFGLDDPVSDIGRDAQSTVLLHDTEISRKHAELRPEKDGYVLYDLHSSNGTFLNGERIESRPISSGDKILIGKTEMIFQGGPPLVLASSLSSKIHMTPAQSDPESSAIISSIKQSEASQYLRHPERAESQWLKNALSNLETMYEASRAINRISDIEQLLDYIMDLVFGSIGADRGCIVLKDAETGKLEPTAVRFAEGIDGEERITLSQTITDWVLDRNEGVVVLDASRDQRFSSAESVTQIGIREAICVPLQGRHEILGVMYVDTKTDSSKVLKTQKAVTFTDDHLKLMIAIAHQAGLAIEDSRFYLAMVRAERLAAVGQTIAILSHHIKNIMQGLRNGSYLIEMGLKEKRFETLESGWEVVQKNQERIYNLVMDMLSYSKDREPVLEMSDLNQLAEEVNELMANRAKELGVQLITNFDPDLPKNAIDLEAIHRALLNIVTNAIDAFESLEDKTNARIVITTVQDHENGQLRLEVSDNGVGIPSARLESIFDIFESTKGNRGSGLGLAVSQKIVNEHGGKISVTSKEGQGSRFVIELPIRQCRETFTDDGHIETKLGLPTSSIVSGNEN